MQEAFSMSLFLIVLSALVTAYILLLLVIVLGIILRITKSTKDHTPFVSVIVPARNEESSLPTLLNSLEQQIYPGKLEFIIIDDRSDDGTSSIIREASRRDSRYRYLRLDLPNDHFSPKVNAVNAGIQSAKGEIIITTDADCIVPPYWVRTMVRHFRSDVCMVVGLVEPSRAQTILTWHEYFETIDWFSLMLAMRSLLRLGLPLASTANNQAYRRESFEKIGGFSGFGKSPSGDEDLLTQKLAKLPGMKIVIADDQACRVFTQPMPSFKSLLRQRIRWVSRYHHPMHYQPGFLAGLILLAGQSTMLTIAIVAIPFAPKIALWVIPLWGIKIGVELFGINLGLIQLGRRDLVGLPTLLWAVLHAPFIAIISVWSLIKPGDWSYEEVQSRKRDLYQRFRKVVKKHSPRSTSSGPK